MRVMTYNIRHGMGNDGIVDLQRIAAIVRDSAADIVALQEVDRFWTRSGGIDQAAELARLLDMDSRFGANLRESSDAEAPTAEYGTLILSRFVIVEHDNTLFPTHDGFEQRGLQEVQVRHPSHPQPITILNTHLQVGSPDTEDHARSQRLEQATLVAQRIAEIDGPAVLMGDFNADPESVELAPLTESLQDAWLVAGFGSDGKTIPTDSALLPTQRIDVIFASRRFRCAACEVRIDQQTRLASDHYPVVADLELLL